MENEHNNAVPEEKKPGYPMHKRKYTPLYTIIVFLYGLLVKLLFFMKIEGRENVPQLYFDGQPSVSARSGDTCAVRAGQRDSFHGQERAV